MSEKPGAGKRFPAIPNDELNTAQREIVYSLAGEVRGAFAPALYSASVCGLLLQSRTRLKAATALAEDVKELVSLLTVSFWSAEYAIRGHSRRAKDAGFDETAIASIVSSKRPKLNEPQEIAFDLCHELLSEHSVSDATFASAVEKFGRAGVIEIIGVCGHYTMVSMLLNTGEVRAVAN